jgi:glycerol uptake facilitator-like aquaporin
MVCITGKACEEHTACEGKAFEEWVCGIVLLLSLTLVIQRHAQAHKKAEPIQVKLIISSTGFIASVQSSPVLNQAIQQDV